MKKRILDTDTLSLWMRGDAVVTARVNTYLSDFDYLTMTIINEYEIRRGLEHRNATTKMAQFETFLEDNEVLDFSLDACKIAARVYAQLRQTGELLPDADILIAAIALANDCVLVTNNERHFTRIFGLIVENWKDKER